MSEAFLTSPKIGEEGRKLFEEKFAEGDQVVTAQLRVDATLRRLYKYIDGSSASEEDLADIESLVETHLAEAIKSTSYENSSDIMHYFHLKIKYALAKQIVCAQFAFNKRDRFEFRRELADGTYGAIADVLDEAVTKYDDAYSGEAARLTGIINELTALALLNRRQTPERLAIPSDITSDLYNATDLEYFTFTKGKSESTIYHIQVKTSNRHSETVRMPLGGILVTAENMGNTHNDVESFPVSRAIIADVNAQDTPEQEQLLASAVQNFNDHMQLGIVEADKLHAVLHRMSPKIRGAMKAVQNIIDKAMEEHPNATDITLNFECPEK